MLKTNHSRNIQYIMGELFLYNEDQNDWVRIFPKDIGDIKYSVRSDDHNGWLKCDGRSLSRTDYTDLFDIIGTSFGSADINHFNLPDTRGRVLGAVGTGAGLTARSLGQTVGTETHTLTVNQMPTHSHTGTTDSSGTHTHSSNAVGGTVGLAIADGTNTVTETDASGGELNVWTTPQALSIDSAGAHTHAFTTGTTGSSQSFNIMQPTAFVGNVFILGSYDRD